MTEGWKTYPEDLDLGHWKDHDTSDTGAWCWCRPRVAEGGSLIIHNSLDRREEYEASVH